MTPKSNLRFQKVQMGPLRNSTVVAKPLKKSKVGLTGFDIELEKRVKPKPEVPMILRDGTIGNRELLYLKESPVKYLGNKEFKGQNFEQILMSIGDQKPRQKFLPKLKLPKKVPTPP